MESMSLSSCVKFGAINFGSWRGRSVLLYPGSRFIKCSCVATVVSTDKESEAEAAVINGDSVTVKKPTRRTNTITNTNTISINRSKKDIAAELKENWLDSLSSPFLHPFSTTNASSSFSSSTWVLGVDPDVSGAIALLKPQSNGDHHHCTASYTAQVFDSPHVTMLIGKRSRRRLDAKSIVQLLRSFDAPVGTTAYVEQSTPFPQDGKLGWWSGGFGYGLWIGVLVASGFSVVPVPSLAWKNKFCLSGSHSSKDDSRELASTLFPAMCPLLKRKKDHGRAEALLIAAYGKGLNLSTNLQDIPEDLA